MTWSLAITAPRAEFRVADTLLDRGVTHHLFKIREVVAHRGVVRDRIVAAFPRYVFVWVAIDELYQQIVETVHGIVDFARDGASVWRGSDGVLSEVLSRADSNGFLPDVQAPCPFFAGQRVIVRGNNIIAGYQAVFQRSIGNGRAIVEQEWLGRYVPIAVHIGDLDALAVRRRKKRRHHRSRRKSA